MSTFAERFKNLRIEKNLTQKELSDDLGISKSSIGMYENGNREPNFDLLEKIADYFNVDMDYLLGKSDIANKYKLSQKSADDDEESIFSEVDDMTNELFEKHKLLFSKTKNASVNDMKKIIAIVDTLMGENDDE